jgi:hypothetical protein
MVLFYVCFGYFLRIIYNIPPEFIVYVCYFNIFFYVIERGRREWSGGAGAWRPEGVRDLSAVTVLHDHKQWLVG